jgi:hypothetical protein
MDVGLPGENFKMDCRDQFGLEERATLLGLKEKLLGFTSDQKIYREK